VRLFLAINLPQPLRHELYALAEPLRAAAPDVAWVREPLLHLTLRFFGEQPEDLPARLRAPIEAAASRHRPPTLQFTEPGAFPNLRRPRVIWIGVEHHPRLELLHHDVEVACASLGFEPEGRPFRPHLTLGRVRKSPSPVAQREQARALARAASAVATSESFTVESIDLMQSTLTPNGRQYDALFRAPLRAG
jgi:2'-5' RNA ligase